MQNKIINYKTFKQKTLNKSFQLIKSNNQFYYRTN